MQRHLQLELLDDHRCRLAVPSLHVPRAHISWHWDPDALARWHTVMPSRLVSRVAPPCAEAFAGVQDWRWEDDGKARSRLKEWITSVLDYYGVWHPAGETAVVRRMVRSLV